jgi:hypothetical protein
MIFGYFCSKFVLFWQKMGKKSVFLKFSKIEVEVKGWAIAMEIPCSVA